jgi:putative endopeptidase
VIEENQKRLREISEKAASTDAPAGSNDQKIGDFWRMAMDTQKIEKEGLTPIKPLLDKIAAVKDQQNLVNTVAYLKKIGSSTLFSDYVGQDSKNSELIAYQLYQGGLGLPEREYYFKSDSTTIDIRNKYVEYITKILSMSGEPANKAEQSAKNILQLETKLASASRKIEDLRDPYKNYNKMSVADLDKLSANISWKIYLPEIGVRSVDSVIVGQPEFFTTLNTLLKTIPMDDWKAYVKFNLISDYAAVLPDAYGVEAFNFNKLFSGAKQRKPRWKKMIQLEEDDTAGRRCHGRNARAIVC